ncbi:hypothetical protein D3C80_1613090 [compost metagenome]
MPVLGGQADHVDRQHTDQHQQEEHDAPAEPVGEHTQRQAHQRTGEYRCSGQQAELGVVKVQQLLDRNAEYGEHHPDHEADSERQGAHTQNQALLYPQTCHSNPP